MRGGVGLAVALFAALAGVAAWVVSRGRPPVEKAVPSAVVIPAPMSRPSFVPLGHRDGQADASARGWEEFRQRYGNELRPLFSGGRLASARSAPAHAVRAAPGFRIGDRRRVIARAREVVEAASGLLGLRPDFPLGDPVLNQSSVSAQVYFEQTYEGVPLAPRGSVTVDLGTDGELLGLFSDYVVDVAVSDEAKITSEQARVRAGIGFREPADGGRLVYWLTGLGGSARRAYEFTVEGHRVVVDAGTGAVLSRRDRRHRAGPGLPIPRIAVR